MAVPSTDTEENHSYFFFFKWEEVVHRMTTIENSFWDVYYVSKQKCQMDKKPKQNIFFLESIRWLLDLISHYR